MTIYTTPESFEDTTPSAGGRLGAGLGAGLGEGLKMLLQNKIQQMQQEKANQAAQQLGIPPGLSPELQKEYFKQTSQNEKLARLQELLSGASQTGASQTGASQTGAPQVGAEGMAPSSGQTGFSDEQILAIGAQDPTLAKLLQSQKQDVQKGIYQKEERSFKRSEKYLNRLEEKEASLPKKKIALSQMRSALETGDFNSFRNKFAEATGQDWLKTSSAQVVNSALKEFLISSLSEVKGRPNQFLEKQVLKAMISPYYADESNTLIMEGLEAGVRFTEKESDIANDLEEKYVSEGKEIPRNFRKLVKSKVNKEFTEWENSYEKKMTMLLNKQKEAASSDKAELKPTEILMIDPQGKIRAVEKKDAKAAKAAGYKLGS